MAIKKINKFMVEGLNDDLNNITEQLENVQDYRRIEYFTSAAGQTVFNLENEYEQFSNCVEVEVEGMPQQDAFIESSPTSITFKEPLPAGLNVRITTYGKTLPLGTDLEQRVNNQGNTITHVLNEISSTKAQFSKSTNALYQKLMMKPLFGMGNSQIFERAETAPQGMAYVRYQDQDLIFILSKANSEPTWGINELQRITCFEYREDGTTVQHSTFTAPLSLSHQGIKALVENNKLYLYCGYGYGNLSNNGKGYTKLEWKGANTTLADAQRFQLIGDETSTHYLKDFNHATPCVSKDGKYIVLALATTYNDNTRYFAVWDRKQVEQASNPLNVPHLYMSKIEPPPFKDAHIVQDVACDGNFIYIGTSGVAPTLAKCVSMYTIQGQYLGYFRVDSALGEYSSITDNPIYGNATQMELEGIDIKDDSLLILATDVWQKDGVYTRRDKVIHKVYNSTDGTGKPIDSGRQPMESPSRIHISGVTSDVSYPSANAYTVSQWDEQQRQFRKSFGFHAQNELRVYDSSVGANNESYAKFKVVRTDNRAYTEIRGSNNLENGSGINLYAKEDTEFLGSPVILYSLDSNNQTQYNVRIQETGAWRPGTDGSQNLGTGTNKWNNIYASTGTISTSDERYKTQITNIDATVLRAWEKVNYKQFKYISAINEKGEENARIHTGVIAQEIIEAFDSEGLDAFDYGLITKDEYEDESYVLGIRATECLFLEAALMRSKLESILAHINTI